MGTTSIGKARPSLGLVTERDEPVGGGDGTGDGSSVGAPLGGRLGAGEGKLDGAGVGGGVGRADGAGDGWSITQQPQPPTPQPST